MVKSFVIISSVAVLCAAPALSQEWTGFYVGAELGFADVDANSANSANSAGSDDGLIGGLLTGYDYDLGEWVVGAGFDYDFADISLGTTTVDSVYRVKARGGYKAGDGLIYATTGYAHIDTDNAGDDGGYFIGGGYEHLLTDQFSVGGELIYHKIDTFNSGPDDLDATSVQFRGSFRF
ncbi:outer membrane protein [Roseovarius sp. EL26]|uniref:outer membrane protein n=1 Tax=Roseovarius sp. EL26 TaxID=2126672 RepID=UPI000EA3A86F|nr:outer membrane beta-barrel protein [Roseovarius sp. EL26]